MSKYTTEVRYICEVASGQKESQGRTKVGQILNDCWDKVFDFDFPIYKEQYRQVLCKKILLHYYTREIGAESEGLWKLWLMARMNEIMPYYNKLYELAELKIDPVKDVDYTTTHKGKRADSGNVNDTFSYSPGTETVSTNSGTVKNDTSGGTRTIQGYSDTPQGKLGNVESMNYLSSAQQQLFTTNQGNKQTLDTTNTTTQKGGNTTNHVRDLNSTDEYVNTVVGKTAGSSYGKLIREYRDSLQNVDMMIIRDLSDLFMNIW